MGRNRGGRERDGGLDPRNEPDFIEAVNEQRLPPDEVAVEPTCGIQSGYVQPGLRRSGITRESLGA